MLSKNHLLARDKLLQEAKELGFSLKDDGYDRPVGEDIFEIMECDLIALIDKLSGVRDGDAE